MEEEKRTLNKMRMKDIVNIKEKTEKSLKQKFKISRENIRTKEEKSK